MAETPEIIVTDDYFGGVEGIRSILNDYYENELRQLDVQEQRRARVFIEEGLIVGGKRVLVSEGVEKENYEIDPELLRKLLDSRVIREERTHLGKSYEVSHDALVAPILESYEKRRLEAERLATRQKLEAERRKRRRITVIAVAGFALALLSLIQTIRAQRASQMANLARMESESLYEQLVEEERKQDSLRYENYLNVGQNEMKEGDYEAAIQVFEFALDIRTDSRLADSLKKVSYERLGQKENFDLNFQDAQAANQKGNPLRALQIIRNIYTFELDPPSSQKVRQLENEAKQALYARIPGEVMAAKTLASKGNRCSLALDRLQAVEQALPYLDRSKLSGEIKTIAQIKSDCAQQ